MNNINESKSMTPGYDIVTMNHGSVLYGTNSENSDTDIKGVYMPYLTDLILGKHSKSYNTTTNSNSKNTKDDIDIEMFSIHEFFKLVTQGEMIVIDMLHAPDDKLISTSEQWKFIRENRSKFYTKRLNGYMGYIIKQTNQYSIKGDRLLVLEECLNVLKKQTPNKDLGTVFGLLKTNEYCMFHDYPADYVSTKKYDKFMFEILGKKFHGTCSIERVVETLTRIYESYGHRAIASKNNNGIDWKALSHAFRACYQLKEIYETGDLIYPLKDADYIKQIKYGQLNYVDDKLPEHLNELVNEVTLLSNKSDFPERLDTKFMEQFILQYYAKGMIEWKKSNVLRKN